MTILIKLDSQDKDDLVPKTAALSRLMPGVWGVAVKDDGIRYIFNQYVPAEVDAVQRKKDNLRSYTVRVQKYLSATGYFGNVAVSSIAGLYSTAQEILLLNNPWFQIRQLKNDLQSQSRGHRLPSMFYTHGPSDLAAFDSPFCKNGVRNPFFLPPDPFGGVNNHLRTSLLIKKDNLDAPDLNGSKILNRLRKQDIFSGVTTMAIAISVNQNIIELQIEGVVAMAGNEYGTVLDPLVATMMEEVRQGYKLIGVHFDDNKLLENVHFAGDLNIDRAYYYHNEPISAYPLACDTKGALNFLNCLANLKSRNILRFVKWHYKNNPIVRFNSVTPSPLASTASPVYGAGQAHKMLLSRLSEYRNDSDYKIIFDALGCDASGARNYALALRAACAVKDHEVSLKMVDSILQFKDQLGIDINAKGKKSGSALHRALTMPTVNSRVVRALFRGGAIVEDEDQELMGKNNIFIGTVSDP